MPFVRSERRSERKRTSSARERPFLTRLVDFHDHSLFFFSRVLLTASYSATTTFKAVHNTKPIYFSFLLRLSSRAVEQRLPTQLNAATVTTRQPYSLVLACFIQDLDILDRYVLRPPSGSSRRVVCPSHLMPTINQKTFSSSSITVRSFTLGDRPVEPLSTRSH